MMNFVRILKTVFQLFWQGASNLQPYCSYSFKNKLDYFHHQDGQIASAKPNNSKPYAKARDIV